MNFIKENLKSVILFIAIIAIIIVSYFLIDKQLSGILGAIGFFSWFLREYTKQLLTKDLEKFKITYEKLHAERAEVIKEIYGMISEICGGADSPNSLNYCIAKIGDSSSKEINERVYNKISSLVDHYEKNKIFFEKELAGHLDALIEIFKKVRSLLYLARKQPRIETNGKPSVDYQLLVQAIKEMNEKVPKIKELIENKFRKIIGIED